jgi:hypothetical protein
MTDYHSQVKIAVEATEFHSPTAYSCFGRQSGRLPRRVQTAMTPRTSRSYLLSQLGAHLYTGFYICGGALSTPWGEDRISASPRFVEKLSAANTGTGCWDAGWEVRAVEPGKVLVCKNGLALLVERERCQPPDDGPIEPGACVKQRLPKELLGISPGYYFALSDREDPSDGPSRQVRLYWNLSAEGAEVFVHTATRLLNEARIFFKLKVLNDASCYMRCDAGVVYVRKDDFPFVAGILGWLYGEVSRYLKPGVPTFTKPVARGVGLAEDPGQGESFGQNRCRLLAEGLIRAHEQGARSLDARLQVVLDCYAAAGVRLDRPYLNGDSADDYTFQTAL